MFTKLPEIADLEESEELGYQQTRDEIVMWKRSRLVQIMLKRDTMQQRKVYWRETFQPLFKNVCWRKRKDNKLSSHYEKEPYQVTGVLSGSGAAEVTPRHQV